MMSTEVGRRLLLLRKALKLTAAQLPADCQFRSSTERWVSECQQKRQLVVEVVAGSRHEQGPGGEHWRDADPRLKNLVA
jgi:hypothetical protein